MRTKINKFQINQKLWLTITAYKWYRRKPEVFVLVLVLISIKENKALYECLKEDPKCEKERDSPLRRRFETFDY